MFGFVRFRVWLWEWFLVESIDITSLFYSGNYDDVRRHVIDWPERARQSEQAPKIVGAHAFCGRVADAEALFQRWSAALSPRQVIESRFYLGVGFCRHSDYAKARGYFAQNLRAGKGGDDLSVFFAYQGLAFYRYFCGRYRQSLRVAELAWRAANAASFTFGKAFAADLKAHCLMETGQIRAGLATIDEAVECARRLGNGGLIASFGIARVVQKARFGVDAHGSLAEIRAELESPATQDVHSQTALLLELGRQCYLRGRADEAREALDRACRGVYGMRHRRYSAMLNLRYAHLLRLSGDFIQALNLVCSARRELDLAVDTALHLELAGLEAELCRVLGLDTDAGRLGKLTQRSSRFVALRMGQRHRGPSEALVGQDPLGDLKDDLARRGHEALPGVARSGFWGLLFDAPGIVPHERAFHFNLVDECVVLVDHGNVDVSSRLCTPIFLRLLQRLVKGPATKELLIREVWGYKYRPLQHDNLVYTAMSRLRQLLGPRAKWIQSLDGIYALVSGIRIYDHARDLSRQAARPPVMIKNDELNLRQRQILAKTERDGSVDVRTCLTEFEVSDMTLRRDLRALTASGILRRIGRGRATKYILEG